GVSAYEMLALTHLQAGPLRVGDLGRRIALSSGAMTGLVDRLVGAGLVMRASDPDDGRRVLLHLTPEAHERMADVQRPHRDALRRCARRFTGAERTEALRLFSELTTLVRESRTEDPWST